MMLEYGYAVALATYIFGLAVVMHRQAHCGLLTIDKLGGRIRLGLGLSAILHQIGKIIFAMFTSSGKKN